MHKKLKNVLQEYESQHSSTRNQSLHEITLPFVIAGTLGSLASLGNVPGYRWANIGTMLWAWGTIWILRKSPRLGLLVGGFSAGLFAVARFLPDWVNVVMAGVGFAIQVYGHHRFEGNRPAILTSLKQGVFSPIWSGPIWLVFRLVSQDLPRDDRIRFK